MGSTTAGPGGRADTIGLVLQRVGRGARRRGTRLRVLRARAAALMGDAAYAELARHCAAHLAAQLPLLIHPATADARRRAAATPPASA